MYQLEIYNDKFVGTWERYPLAECLHCFLKKVGILTRLLDALAGKIDGSSSAAGHDKVTASAKEDSWCLPVASTWSKCHDWVGGKFILAPLAGMGCFFQPLVGRG